MTTNKPQLHALTSARGVAALWVVTYHFLPLLPDLPSVAERILAHGYLAVDLFFVLSGFVLAYTHLERFDALRRGTYVDFIVRRIARIYPLHLLIMLAYLSMPAAYALSGREVPDALSPLYYAASLLLLQNWGFTDSLAWNVPAWSISTELGAYLLFPLLAVLLHRVRAESISIVVLLLVVLSVGLYFESLDAPSIGHDIPRTGLIRCLLAFASGMLAFLVWERLPSDSASRRRRAAILVLCGALAIIAFTWGEVPDYWLAPAMNVMAVLLLAHPPAGLSRFVGIPPLVLLGEISYSVYLSHFLLRDLFKLIVVKDPDTIPLAAVFGYFAVLLLVSWLLWKTVEKPAQRAVLALHGRRVQGSEVGYRND